MQPVKAQASLRIRAVSPEPSLFAHMNYGSRRWFRPKISHLALLDDCACVFEEWIYGGQKVPKSHELAQIIFLRISWWKFLSQSLIEVTDKRDKITPEIAPREIKWMASLNDTTSLFSGKYIFYSIYLIQSIWMLYPDTVVARSLKKRLFLLEKD